MPSYISSKENLSPFVYLEGFKDSHHLKNDYYIIKSDVILKKQYFFTAFYHADKKKYSNLIRWHI